MKQYIKISIVYILCPFLFAQKIPVNPDHNVYPYLYRQSTNGILPQWIQSVRPLTIDQVLSLLNDVKENDEINNDTRILAEQFISEFISPKNSGCPVVSRITKGRQQHGFIYPPPLYPPPSRRELYTSPDIDF